MTTSRRDTNVTVGQTAWLTAWLIEQIAEDERLANTIRQRHWEADGAAVIADHPTNRIVDYVYEEGAAEHIARWDPKRVLAECEAKRRIVDECKHWYDRLDLSVGSQHDECWLRGRFEIAASMLRMFASSYTDRPGYRPEWKP